MLEVLPNVNQTLNLVTHLYLHVNNVGTLDQVSVCTWEYLLNSAGLFQ